MRRAMRLFPLVGKRIAQAGAVLWLMVPSSTMAQGADGVAGRDRLSVFLDCDGRTCNEVQTFFRTEITWVDWVRGREDSDVHVILTDQRTGSGGTEYRLDFIGRGRLDGANDQLFFRSLGTDVEQEAYDGLTTTFAVGLARFAALAGLRDFVTFEAVRTVGVNPTARLVDRQEVDDPWNLWVFNVGASGTLDGTDSEDTQRLSGNFSADRTTPTWKLAFGLRANRNVVETLLSDSSIFTSTQTDWNVDAQMVYALADHWSVGVIANTGKMPRANQDFRLEVTPALEYSVFPYEESTRKALTARYAVGPAFRNYQQETLFGKTQETRFEQALRIGYSHRQPWGDGSASITASHMLDNIDQHNVSLRGSVSFRVARGLSLDAGANASWVTDQIYLSGQGETDEEILLNLRMRASSFNYGANIGFSYRFGSIYNNVVNNRFRPNFGG